MIALRTALLDKMRNIAEIDGKITDEENDLIEETTKIIMELDEDSKKMLRS